MNQVEKNNLLKKFMQEFFDFNELLEVGFFTKEMKNNYELQAKRVCEFFGFKTVYEYGSIKVRCHISEANTKDTDNFITKINSIYD